MYVCIGLLIYLTFILIHGLYEQGLSQDCFTDLLQTEILCKINHMSPNENN